MLQFDTFHWGIIIVCLLLISLIWKRMRNRSSCKESNRTTITKFEVDVHLIWSPKGDQIDHTKSEAENFDQSAARETGPSKFRPTKFLIDSLLLEKSFQFVCPTRMQSSEETNGFKESFHYATGIRVDDRTFAVTQIVPVRYARQAAGGVLVANDSNITALADLDRMGLPLIMHFHSHPGFGRESNRPSMIDRKFQERLERGGHLAVGGIFSRDGYVRWFAGDLDRFVIEVQGNNVKKVGDNEFKIELDDKTV